eukprot:scaffold139046_cov20-Prasinocladus_malaysianus.AAC.2
MSSAWLECLGLSFSLLDSCRWHRPHLRNLSSLVASHGVLVTQRLHFICSFVPDKGAQYSVEAIGSFPLVDECGHTQYMQNFFAAMIHLPTESFSCTDCVAGHHSLPVAELF